MTDSGNTILIFNPAAGKIRRGGGALVQRVVEILTSAGRRVTAVPTPGPCTAGRIAREHIERGAQSIIVAGGDGSINEAAEGIIGSAVPLGIVPAGTANVLAMETGLGSNPEEAAKRLTRCVPRRIAVGHVTCDGGAVSRHFLLMAGIGLDAHVVYHVSGALKARTGKFAYWVAGSSVLGQRLAEFDIRIDAAPRRCSFALLSRVRNYGGDFEIAREVNLLHDRFEAVLFEGRSPVLYLKYLLGMALRRLKGMNGVAMLPAHCATVSCPDDRRVYLQIDGEYAGRLPATIRLVPDALTLLLPPDYGI